MLTDEAVPFIVIDNGSGQVKAGGSFTNFPICNAPIIGRVRPKYSNHPMFTPTQVTTCELFQILHLCLTAIR